MNQGVITIVKDLVIHVEFAENVPEIGEMLIVDNKDKAPLLVDTIKNESTVVCINLRASKSIQKAMPVFATGKGVEVPVGEAVIGRIFDALGAPLDG